jgi:hypothetical protein
MKLINGLFEAGAAVIEEPVKIPYGDRRAPAQCLADRDASRCVYLAPGLDSGGARRGDRLKIIMRDAECAREAWFNPLHSAEPPGPQRPLCQDRQWTLPGGGRKGHTQIKGTAT